MDSEQVEILSLMQVGLWTDGEVEMAKAEWAPWTKIGSTRQHFTINNYCEISNESGATASQSPD